jgi:hypothetical protein
MSAGQSPSPKRDNGQGTADSSDSVIVEATGPGDTTIRPRPPNVPRYYPGREPPPDHTAAKPPRKNPPPAMEKG